MKRYSVHAPGRGGDRATVVDADSHEQAARQAADAWPDTWRLVTKCIWAAGEKPLGPPVMHSVAEHRVRGFWLALWNRLTRKRVPLLAAEGFDTSHPSERWAGADKGECPE